MMDDDSKQILLLKLGVGFLVFLAIMIVIVIIMSVKNANKKQDGLETTTRRTLSGEVEDITSTSWFSDETTTSSSETTSSTTSSTNTTTAAPITQAPTTSKKASGGGSGTTKKSSSSGGGSSSGGSGGSGEVGPNNTYTIIGSNDASSYNNADNSMEWALVNKINQNTGNKYKVAMELRTAAERIAEVCCQAPGSCNEATKEFVNQEYQLTFKAFVDNTATYNANYFYNNLATTKLLNGNYKYLGVGIYKATRL